MTVIRPLAEEEIPLLERHMPRMPGTHRERFESQQEGKSVYLIAWHDLRPVGHLLLRWEAKTPESAPSALRASPKLSDIAVQPDWRSRRIGSRLMDEAEHRIARADYDRVGLSVALDNVRARALYERRGYADAGIGEYQTRWPYLDDAGQEQWQEETCIYLVKDLH